MALWGGRFEEAADSSLRQLNDSIGYDRRFYREDIAGSRAYARALVTAGLLTADESNAIINGLDQVLVEFDEGRFVYQTGDEDIHTAVERRLTELVGAVGGKLHTGRSRNDQVATDFRLWVLNAGAEVDTLLHDFQALLVEQAAQHTHTLMPGYTHFQPAQPITAGHWLMSFFWMIARDRERLQDARRRASVMPLGSGALSGHPFAIDRKALAAELGFEAIDRKSVV
jgi:argininosuccinate lyase